MGAYQLKIGIKGSKPPIWRRVTVPEQITFEQLHRIIQIVFQWSDSHLYQFLFRSQKLVVADPKVGDGGRANFQVIKASEQIKSWVGEGSKFAYTYDFGHNWEHVIEVEKILEDYDKACAQVVKFKGDSIPEGCKGLAAYYDMLAALEDENLQKAFEEGNGVDFQDWVESLEMKAYSLDEINERLEQETVGKNKGGNLTVKGLLLEYEREDMLKIAALHGLEGFEKLGDEELAEKIGNRMLDPDYMRRYFLCLSDRELEAFQTALERTLTENGETVFLTEYLYQGAYMAEEENGDYFVAEDAGEVFRQINTEGFRREQKRIGCIGEYLRAAGALYGAFPVSLVIEIFNRYEAEKLTLKELLEVYGKIKPFRCNMEYRNGLLADMEAIGHYMRDHEDCLEAFVGKQKQVTYYLPAREEIQAMASQDGLLMNRDMERMKDFLEHTMKVNERFLFPVLKGIQETLSFGGNLENVVDLLEMDHIVFENDRQVEEFTRIITDVWNHTRMAVNRGHQPCEMVGKEETSSTIKREAAKVYPNDPCPCGSGKKFKKCCGKK
ncbi:MAG TPA: SEC-C domain-containing protein [Candidatus Hungatella pullicola]|nr:SEC-C domain-containing protein [Candidatus Hungatella pullicola]